MYIKKFIGAIFTKINEELSLINWQNILGNVEIEDNSKVFYDKLLPLIEKYAPITKTKTTLNPPWIDKEAVALKNKLKKQYKKFKQTKTNENLQTFLETKDELKNHLSQSFDTYKQEIQQKIITDPKFFYKHVNYIKKNINYNSIRNAFK